jgi:hypothetical protein
MDLCAKVRSKLKYGCSIFEERARVRVLERTKAGIYMLKRLEGRVTSTGVEYGKKTRVVIRFFLGVILSRFSVGCLRVLGPEGQGGCLGDGLCLSSSR